MSRANSDIDTVTVPRALVGDELIGPAWIQCAEGKVLGIGRGAPPSTVTLTLDEGILAPGLIDLQLNGAYGVDLAIADEDGWKTVTRRLPETGVSAFVPTVITAPLPELATSMVHYRQLRPRLDSTGGARTLGMHLEGPFLAPTRRGAHRRELLTDPRPEHVDSLLDAGGDALTYVTLAPERTGAIAAIAAFVEAGVRVAIGHTDASSEQVCAATDAGATLVTHLYNAQRPLHHRDPGVVGAALADPRLTLGLIVDLHHVAPTAVSVAFAAASGRISLVTDAISALGMPPGLHVLGGQSVEVLEHGPPRRADGTLAGSVLTLGEAIANSISCGISPAVALVAATRVPADAMGRQDLGRLATGTLADLVWFRKDWTVGASWVGGRLSHTAPGVAALCDLGPSMSLIQE